VRENRTHGSEGGDGESRFRPLSNAAVLSIPGSYFKDQLGTLFSRRTKGHIGKIRDRNLTAKNAKIAKKFIERSCRGAFQTRPYFVLFVVNF
jgi:hypothetical protein